MIRVEHLIKNYGPRVAVADVTFDVGKGEVLGFAGLVGAGRSEVARAIFGVEEAIETDVTLDEIRAAIGKVKP